MKIDRIHLKNIGVFADCELVFPAEKPAGKAEIHVFTGVNGSGKSTVLMGLASAFDNEAALIGEVGSQNLLDSRARGEENMIQVSFKNGDMVNWLGNGQSSIKRSDVSWSKAIGPSSKSNIPFERVNEWAAFSYSGYRVSQSRKITGLNQPIESPLKNAVKFFKENQASEWSFNQWIVNQYTKSGLSIGQGDHVAAQQYLLSVDVFKKAITEITGHGFDFKMGLNPLSLGVVLDGRALPGFDALPDGLRSLLSWLGDLLMRLDELKWTTNTPILEREFILFLDEIEVHLHPSWQRKVLPVVQNLFPNAQIFLSTHSPFVVNSVDGAWIYKFELDENGDATIAPPVKSEDGNSYQTILRSVFGIEDEFGVGVHETLDHFYELRNEVLKSKNGEAEALRPELLRLGLSLAKQSEKLNLIVQMELRQIQKLTGLELAL